MKNTLLFAFAFVACLGCASQPPSPEAPATKSQTGYANVGGLKMYYEIHGQGEPLVLLHGGGSTITTSFGRVLPLFAKTRRVIAIEEQAHGHTADIGRPLTFEQSADDVAALLGQLKVTKADFMGFSNGGNIAMQVAIRHPDLVRKLVVASSMTRRDAMNPEFWIMMRKAKLDQMPEGLREAYLKVAPDPNGLQAMHDKCAERMVKFRDWSVKTVRSIQAPTLVLIGDADIVRPEHAVHMMRLIPQSRLAIVPGDHGSYLGESTTTKTGSRQPEITATMIEEFLADTQPIPERKQKRDE